MTKYQATIGYKAVITVDVKAESEEEAKKKTLDLFKQHRDKKMYSDKIQLTDDNFSIHGLLNVSETYDELYN